MRTLLASIAIGRDPTTDYSPAGAGALEDVHADFALTFTPPASGKVLIVVRVMCYTTTASREGYIGLREGAATITGSRVWMTQGSGSARAYREVWLGPFTGLSGSKTWKLAFESDAAGECFITSDADGESNVPVQMEAWGL